ncbi:MAG: CRISPR-associated endonuclease Cas2 [Thermoproteus sp.]
MELYLLVIYDISDDDLRLKVADFLKAKGLVRVQRSAFIGPGSTALKRDVEVGLASLVRGRAGVNVQVFLLTGPCYKTRSLIGDVRYEWDGGLVIT